MKQQSADAVVQDDLNYICDKAGKELSKLSGKRLLITGGAGFLGYYLVQGALHWNRYFAKGDSIEVTVYDSFMRGKPAWLSDLESDPKLSVVRHDIRDPLPQDIGRFEYLIHGASIASPIYYRKHPLETMDANVGGLRHLIDYALEQDKQGTPLDGFLFYSSSEIYGDPTPENIPTPEDYRGNVSCTGPRACYDESKRYGETLCVTVAQEFGIPARIARPFNNYGPGLKISDRRALPDFARDIFAGRDIVLLSDGSPTRTFCYVTDAVVGYLKVLVNGRNGESYNIGTDAPEISIRELAERVVAIARETHGYEGRLVFGTSSDSNYLVDNPNRRCPRIDKAREELGYEPGIGLDDGLYRSLMWYSGNQEAEDA